MVACSGSEGVRQEKVRLFIEKFETNGFLVGHRKEQRSLRFIHLLIYDRRRK